ncbi:HNH endonuclease signature motif containing protein, partial [Sediminivirga luteola]|uniref:HNH endonuclease signature motif containing protein n=1 Tax=Sediminivirga luteola TaxID=1774748 RepID=UPI001F47A031
YEPGAGLEALRDVRVDIGITIPIGTLAGKAQAPGTAPDGSWTLPADQVRELALSPAGGQVFWHRLLIDDSDDGGGEVLSHTYAGRFPPRVLQAALRFRDGTCSVPGCRVPAADCDTDHRTAWPAGPTRASNLWSLCRRHHRWKTLGIIEPVRTSDDGSSDSHSTSNPVRWGWVLPSGRVVRVEPVDHRPIAETPPSTYTGIDSLPVGLAGEVLGEFPDAFPPRGPASGLPGMPLDEDFWDEGSWEDGPPPP